MYPDLANVYYLGEFFNSLAIISEMATLLPLGVIWLKYDNFLPILPVANLINAL